MAERKNITIHYFKLESSIDTFMLDIQFKFDALLEAAADYGFFDGKTSEYMFKQFEPISLSDHKLYIVGICKEKVFLPVWFNREGALENVPLSNGSLGEVSYGLFDTDNGALIMMTGGMGGPTVSAFSDFARWLTGDSAAGVSPIFMGDVYDQVTQWEIFRKLNLSIEAPASDFVGNVLDSELGENFKILETLSGLKIDISVSMGHGKGSLHKDAVKNFMKTIFRG